MERDINHKQHPEAPGPGGPPVARILVIDDEQDMLANYRRLLGRVGYECITATDSRQAVALLMQHQADLVITDLLMPGGSGDEVLEQVHEYDKTVPVIMVTAHGTIGGAVAAMKKHATDYLTKPFAAEDLLGKIQEALSRRLIARSAAKAEGAAPARHDGPRNYRIWGTSPKILEAVDLARKAARTDVNVVIFGESGTGKELFARLIHHLSPRNREIFVPVDCTSLPESLLESELFGYCKGAFTGATTDKMGLFQFAHHGTLFLDEVGEIPLSLQSKFLRVLQERRFRPIGSTREIDIDVRVVAATNVNLEQAIRDKTFRSDLYYRLNVVTLHIPPLRDRREDVPLLANYFLRKFTRRSSLHHDGFTPGAIEALKEYGWPGNVRQLQNMVERLITLTASNLIRREDLPEEIRGAAEPAGGDTPTQLFSKKTQLVEHFERDYLIRLLAENQFNISRAAQVAGCHRRTLYRMIHRYNLDLDDIRLRRGAKLPPDQAANF